MNQPELRGLTNADMDMSIWRYMSFEKFISLLTYQALWFSKLKILEDKFEGMMPSAVKVRMNNENQKWKQIFPAELHNQIDSLNDKNEESGRELTLVNCWFIGETESKRMWDEYAPLANSVAIKSTPKMLLRGVLLGGVPAAIGKVRYVDHHTHEMSAYHASQTFERAFIKDDKYSHENELRLARLNTKNIYQKMAQCSLCNRLRSIRFRGG
jgi:hypothetical protein